MESIQRIIKENIMALPPETVDIYQASGRITAENIYAKCNIPFCDESLRDGYVVPCVAKTEKNDFVFPVTGEIAAGDQKIEKLLPGTSCRIYTGGLIPAGGCRVVPHEQCSENEGIVSISPEILQSDRLFIRRKGSEIREGELLVSRGVRLCLDHLTLLASVGLQNISVCSQPSVVCFCTGKELLEAGGQLIKGRKISTNSFLLQKLIPRYGGSVDECCIIADDSALLDNMFAGLKNKQADVVISTGGMGPGKYDLVKDAFCAAGGTILLSSLPMRPGKSILLGKLKNMCFIALPGPPHAVRTLLTEFVGPILLRLQGAANCWPENFQASLEHSFRVKFQKGVQVKSGVLSVENGRCQVRLAHRLEVASCNIIFAAGRGDYQEGDLVWINVDC